MAICPDPRGPLVDREDYVQGQIDALAEIKKHFEDVRDILEDEHFLEVRERLDVSFSGNTPVEQFAADLETEVISLEHRISSALQQARWKLKRVQAKGGAL